MAFMQHRHCHTCNQTKQFTVSSGQAFGLECDECRSKRVADKRQNTLDELKRMSLEDRISRIEEFLYDMPSRSTSPYDMRF